MPFSPERPFLGAASGNSFQTLVPDSWIGRELPISEFALGELKKDETVVLLARDACFSCHEVANAIQGNVPERNVLVVLLDGPSRLEWNGFRVAIAKPETTWLCERPILAFYSENGIVIRSSHVVAKDVPFLSR